jgi:hypothetical protein
MTDLSIWHEVFRILVTDVPKFRYPEWFDYLAEQIPADDSRARRDSPRFLTLLEAVALCRSFSDGRRKKSKEIEINFSDYCVAYGILREAFTSTYVGAHPKAMEFAGAVRQLCSKSKKDVTTKDVAALLDWSEAVAHKWRAVALKQKLIEYKPGTYAQNKKPLLPGPAEQPSTFLPRPQAVLDARPELGNAVKFISAVTGEEIVIHRRGPGKSS